jgi:hypothetical protein
MTGYVESVGLRPRQRVMRILVARRVVVTAVHAGNLGAGIEENEGFICGRVFISD